MPMLCTSGKIRMRKILFDYILLLKGNGDYTTALDATKMLLEQSGDPIYRLAECDLLAASG